MTLKSGSIVPPGRLDAESAALHRKAAEIAMKGPAAMAIELRRVEKDLTSEARAEYSIRLLMLAVAALCDRAAP